MSAGAGVRRQREAAQARIRAKCPPHPDSATYDLYDATSYAEDHAPYVSCRRCFRRVAEGTVAELRADPARLARALAGEPNTTRRPAAEGEGR